MEDPHLMCYVTVVGKWMEMKQTFVHSLFRALKQIKICSANICVHFIVGVWKLYNLLLQGIL